MSRHDWDTARKLEFLAFSTAAESKAEGQRTYLGLLWWLIDPAVSLVVYYIVFEMVLQRGGPNFVLFLFVGLVPWRWLSASLEQSGPALLNSRALMQLVYVPKALFPLRILASNTIKFLPVFCLVIVIVLASGIPPTRALLFLPYIILVQGMLITGCALCLASIVPLFPDLRLIIGNLMRLWLFLSGVFFDVGILEGKLEQTFRLNPMTIVLEAYRDVLLKGQAPSSAMLPALALGCIFAAIAILVMRRLDFQYPKMV